MVHSFVQLLYNSAIKPVWTGCLILYPYSWALTLPLHTVDLYELRRQVKHATFMQQQKKHNAWSKQNASQWDVRSGPPTVAHFPKRLLVISITFTVKTNRGDGDALSWKQMWKFQKLNASLEPFLHYYTRSTSVIALKVTPVWLHHSNPLVKFYYLVQLLYLAPLPLCMTNILKLCLRYGFGWLKAMSATREGLEAFSSSSSNCEWSAVVQSSQFCSTE